MKDRSTHLWVIPSDDLTRAVEHRGDEQGVWKRPGMVRGGWVGRGCAETMRRTHATEGIYVGDQ